MRHAVAVVVVFLLAAGTLSAATFEPVSDAALLERAQLVVIGRVAASASREAAGRMIYTDSLLRVEQVLKGKAPAETLTISELGGVSKGRGILIPGSATYEPGTRVMAFLRQSPDGTYYTAAMALGKYRFSRDARGIEILERDTEGIESDDPSAYAARPANEFVEYIRGGARLSAPRPALIVSNARPETPASQAAASTYVLTGNGKPLRWNCPSDCTKSWTVGSPQQGSVSTPEGVEDAMAAWNGEDEAWLKFAIGGFNNKSGPTNDDVNDIIFNSNAMVDDDNNGGFCDGSLGCAWVYFNDAPFQHTFDGSLFNDIISSDVIVRPVNFSQDQFEAVLAHELGHSIGFKHGPSGALMASSIPSNASLKAYDREAITTVYGEGPPCTAHTITGTSGGGTKPYGSTTQLSVTINPSDAPVDYQWFRGSTGTTVEPVGGNSPNFTTPPIEGPMSFWVRVTSECNPAFVQNSGTINVTASACEEPVITTHPQGQTIQPNGTATLTVAATGTLPLTYRWYRSATAGDETNQVGTQQSFTTPPLQTATSYWVKVSNACGADESNVALISIAGQCVPAAIGTQPASGTVTLGSAATLSVGATGTAPLTYQWFEGTAPDTTKPIAGATGSSFATTVFNVPGTYRYWVRVRNACNQNGAISATAVLTVPCRTPVVPIISVPPTVSAQRTNYRVSWSVPAGGPVGWTFEVQESTSPDFTSPITHTVENATTLVLQKPAITADQRRYFRVRAISKCDNAASGYSAPSNTLVEAPKKPVIGVNGGILPGFSTPFDSNEPLSQPFTLGGFGGSGGTSVAANDTFVITADQPWVTVSPSTGTLPPEGLDITIGINPATLPVGSSGATLTVARTQNAGTVGAFATTSIPIPINISKVTPISPVPRDTNAPNGTLIIPAVAHLDGLNTRFQSDVRIANASGDAINYDLSFTPSGSDGTQSGKRTTITIPGNGNFGLDDLVKVWFGAGSLGEVGSGTLEIRPTTTAGGGVPSPLVTFASSRLYAISDRGTLGQFIPALGATKFIGALAADPLAKISLQQISNVAGGEFRTNLGFVEGSGTNVSMLVKVLNGNNQVVAEKPVGLGPYGHMQTSFAAMFPEVNIADGRIEVTVTSPGGKATAYASVLDNDTNDPLMVFPEQPGRISSARYVIPGVAELVNGASNFHTDMRLFNAAATPVNVTLNYFPQAGDTTPLPPAVTRTIAAGQILAIDNVLPTLWSLSRTGGSVVVTAPGAASLVTTARTFSRDLEGGTYGQFIPGVTAADAVGNGERALEVLQLEDSASYRSNLGLVEVTGNPVTIEITARPPDTKITAVTSLTLGPNEFRQIGRVFNSFGMQNVYNGRVSVKVIAGTGRVAAYGSVVDNRTVDPTYVPAQ